MESFGNLESKQPKVEISNEEKCSKIEKAKVLQQLLRFIVKTRFCLMIAGVAILKVKDVQQ